MALGGMAIGLGLAALAFGLASGSTSSSKGGGGDGGGGGGGDGKDKDLITCDPASLAALPAAMRPILEQALSDKSLSNDQLETVAKSLDELASKTTDPATRKAAQNVAACVRARKGSGTGPGGLDLIDCATAYSRLDPALRTIVLSAMASTTISKDQLEEIAKNLDRGADPSVDSDPKLRQAFAVAASCIRDRAAMIGAGGGTGGGPTLTCEQAFAGLDPSLQAEIVKARKSASQDQLIAAANLLEGTAALVTDATVKANLLKAAQCLRAGGTGETGGGGTSDLIYDEDGHPSSATNPTARKGVASNPIFQWVHLVVAGDNANLITRKYFGSGLTTARVNELIRNNPVDQKGVNLGPIRSDWPAGTPGQTPGVLNWTRLPGGARLRVPKSWDAWVDEQGFRRNGPTPYPSM